jgi:hypothetical protein
MLQLMQEITTVFKWRFWKGVIDCWGEFVSDVVGGVGSDGEEKLRVVGGEVRI